MSTSTPALPVEIVDKILQALNCSDNISYLKTCSLVSNFFLPLSRRYLFQNVTLHITILFVDSIPHVYHNFLPFLSDDTHVASFVRALTIMPHPPHVKLLSKQSVDSSADTPSQTLIHCQHPMSLETAVSCFQSLYNKATSLRHLSIHSTVLSDWTSIDTKLRAALLFLCNITTLQSLELRYVGVSTGELEYFVGPSSSITALTLQGVHYNNPGSPVDGVPAPRSVDTPRQKTGRVPLQLDVLLESAGSSSLMIPLIYSAGQRLYSLKWRSSPNLFNQDTYFHLLELRHLPCLKEITIGFPLRPNTGLDELIGFLTGKRDIRDNSLANQQEAILFETQLENITLEFDCPSLPTEQVYSLWNWGLLDIVLSSRQSVGTVHNLKDTRSCTGLNTYTASLNTYPHLQWVSLSVKHKPINHTRSTLLNQLFEIFQRNLPQATARGLLKKQSRSANDAM